MSLNEKTESRLYSDWSEEGDLKLCCLLVPVTSWKITQSLEVVLRRVRLLGIW